MKTFKKTTLGSFNYFIAFLVVFSISAFTLKADDPIYKVITSSQIKVLGTSNLHDWDMVANQFTCDGTFTVKNGVLQDVKSLQFSLPVTNLKGKEGLLNTRAYKALNSDKYKTITFKLTDATVVSQQKLIKATGNLTISGVTKLVTLQANYVVNADESITCKGSEAVKMSSHNVKAPSFMMGALKTGDAVTIDFILKLKK
jgi:polyisoprenoid-binding protein YceI